MVCCDCECSSVGFISTAKLPSMLVSTDGSRSNAEHVKHPSLSCMDKLNKANFLLREGTQLIPETIRNYTKQISLGDSSYLGDPPDSSAKKTFPLVTDSLLSQSWSKSLQRSFSLFIWSVTIDAHKYSRTDRRCGSGLWKLTENLDAQMQKSKEDPDFYHRLQSSFSEK